MDTHAWIQALPKTELHLHIEGTLEPGLMLELAEKNGIKLPYDGVSEIKKAYDFTNLQSFLDLYYHGAQVLVTEDDFYRLAMAYFKKAHEDGVVHVEVFFDPQTHTDRGIPFETVMAGLIRARDEAKNQYHLSAYLILCFLRHLSEEEAFITLEQALPFQKEIIGVGLDSSEIGNPPEKFKRVFEKARALGFRAVAHAGEEASSEYIWQAIHELQVERIDHGVQAVNDPRLLEHLKKSLLPLTVCPLSNTKLCVFETMRDHTLPTLMAHGLRVTINSDDPSYFGGYINDNYRAIAQAFDLSHHELAELAKNSFYSSFLPDAEIQQRVKQIDDLLQQQSTT